TINRFLEIICGNDTTFKTDRTPMPFSDKRLINILSHTLWILPDINSCYAMKKMLNNSNYTILKNYKVNIYNDSQNMNLSDFVHFFTNDKFNSNTITLTDSIFPEYNILSQFTGIFMLRNFSSPDEYFKTALCIHETNTILKENSYNSFIKPNCYIFEFDLNRAIKYILEFSKHLPHSTINSNQNISTFLEHIPLIAYNGGATRRYFEDDIISNNFKSSRREN
ncbi:MAG: hypothetical protein K6G26_08690, partial [Lachnospiraceae bacterium]|nr:hypothetical protein [Lachnospiraceae bacterium]